MWGRPGRVTSVLPLKEIPVGNLSRRAQLKLMLGVAAATSLAQNLAAQTTEAPPLKIGMLASLTGPGAFGGDPTAKAAKLAVDQVNAAGGINGRKVELTTYDTEGSADKALVFMKRLIGEDQVSVVLGPDFSATVRASLPASEEAKVPVLFMTPIVEPKPDSYQFTTFPSEETSYRVALSHLKARKVHKLSVVATTDLTGESGVKNLQRLSGEYDITLVAIERLEGLDKDVTPQLTNAARATPDAIFYIGTGAGVAVICKGFVRLGLQQPLVISTGAVSGTFPQLLKGIAPDILLFPTYKMMLSDALPADDPNKIEIDKFSKIYEEAYKKKADFYAGSGWDVARIAMLAMGTGGDDRTKIRDAILQIHNFVGAFTTVSFAPGQHRGGGADAQVMGQFKDDKFFPAAVP
jgi:branched-chain amino acid transport system substrate-binding protein